MFLPSDLRPVVIIHTDMEAPKNVDTHYYYPFVIGFSMK